MAIEAGRMVISAGNIEWLNFDFTKAMPEKERIIGASTFDSTRIEGEDVLEIDAAYGDLGPAYERMSLKDFYEIAFSPDPQKRKIVLIEGEQPLPGSPSASPEQVWVGTEGFEANDEGTAYRKIGAGLLDPYQYYPITEKFSDEQREYFRRADTFGLPYLRESDLRRTGNDFDDLDGGNLYNPNAPVNLIEVFIEEGEQKGQPYDPPRFKKIYNTFGALEFNPLPIEEQQSTATDPTRKIVSVATRGVAKARPGTGGDTGVPYKPDRPDGELDSIWLVTCRIRTSPGGLTRSGSMLVVGSG